MHVADSRSYQDLIGLNFSSQINTSFCAKRGAEEKADLRDGRRPFPFLKPQKPPQATDLIAPPATANFEFEGAAGSAGAAAAPTSAPAFVGSGSDMFTFRKRKQKKREKKMRAVDELAASSTFRKPNVVRTFFSFSFLPQTTMSLRSSLPTSRCCGSSAAVPAPAAPPRSARAAARTRAAVLSAATFPASSTSKSHRSIVVDHRSTISSNRLVVSCHATTTRTPSPQTDAAATLSRGIVYTTHEGNSWEATLAPSGKFFIQR